MNSCLIVAHRGCHATTPENTIASLKAAFQAGADMAEIDVQLTRDFVPVIVHDKKIRDCRRKFHEIRRLDFRELRHLQTEKLGLDKSSPEFLIPTLDEVVKKILPSLALNIELKAETGSEARLASEISKSIPLRFDSKIIYSSFSKTALTQLKHIRKSAHLGLLFKANVSNNLRWAKRNHCYSVHPKVTVSKKALIESAHEAGLRVVVWTVNGVKKADQLLNWGVDGIITDRINDLLNRR